jgi:ribonuclease BN (tRNA processing enzyme)
MKLIFYAFRVTIGTYTVLNRGNWAGISTGFNMELVVTSMYGNNEPCWLRCIHILLKHLNMDHMLTHLENFKSRHIYSIKKKIQNNYETFWKINLNKCEKPRTYRKFKFIFRYETCISDIRNISHRNILARFRTSNHKLHIETGRYTSPITPVENRICSNCNSKSVEDELHFLALPWTVMLKSSDSRSTITTNGWIIWKVF